MAHVAGPRTLPALAVLLALMALAGCPEPAEQEARAPDYEPTVAGAADPAAADPGVSPEAFTWTREPTVDDIPARPVEGVIAGIEMTSPRIEIAAEGDGRYRLRFVATRWAFPEEQQPRAPDQVASATLHFTLAQGERGPLQWSLDDSPRDAAASYACAPHPSQYTVYANRRWAAAVEITRWEGGLPTAGRVALCFDDTGASWVAGEFEARAPDR